VTAQHAEVLHLTPFCHVATVFRPSEKGHHQRARYGESARASIRCSQGVGYGQRRANRRSSGQAVSTHAPATDIESSHRGCGRAKDKVAARRQSRALGSAPGRRLVRIHGVGTNGGADDHWRHVASTRSAVGDAGRCGIGRTTSPRPRKACRCPIVALSKRSGVGTHHEIAATKGDLPVAFASAISAATQVRGRPANCVNAAGRALPSPQAATGPAERTVRPSAPQ